MDNKNSKEKIIKMYESLEELAAKSINLHVEQLEGRISSKDAKALLYTLASDFFDLSQEIAKEKRSLLNQEDNSKNSIEK